MHLVQCHVAIIVSSLFLLRADGTFPTTPRVPCYLQPAGNGCHYQLKPGSETCTTPSDRKRLKQNILLVNRTLVSLEKQLIRLGISEICILLSTNQSQINARNPELRASSLIFISWRLFLPLEA